MSAAMAPRDPTSRQKDLVLLWIRKQERNPKEVDTQFWDRLALFIDGLKSIDVEDGEDAVNALGDASTDASLDPELREALLVVREWLLPQLELAPWQVAVPKVRRGSAVPIVEVRGSWAPIGKTGRFRHIPEHARRPPRRP